MQYSLYAFIPLTLLVAIAAIVTCISLWTGKRRRDLPGAAPRVETPRRSAEILHFPSPPSQLPAADIARLRQGKS